MRCEEEAVRSRSRAPCTVSRPLTPSASTVTTGGVGTFESRFSASVIRDDAHLEHMPVRSRQPGRAQGSPRSSLGRGRRSTPTRAAREPRRPRPPRSPRTRGRRRRTGPAAVGRRPRRPPPRAPRTSAAGGGDGDDDPASAQRSQCLHGREHRRAGGETVVDDEDRLAGDVGRRPVTTVERLATLELDALTRNHVVDERLGRTPACSRTGLVEHAHSAARDGAHGQLALAREAELPDDEDVERRVESLGDFTSDRDTATRQSQHEHVLAARVFLGEPFAELAAGLGTVAEPPHSYPASAGRTASPMSSTMSVSPWTRCWR